MATIDVQEIHAMAANPNPDVSSPLYISFTTDPDMVPTCLELILNTFGNDVTMYFCSKCLWNLTKNNIPQWSPDFLQSLNESIFQFFQKAVEYGGIHNKRFCLALDNIVEVYCMVLAKNFTVTNRLTDFTKEISDVLDSEMTNAIFLKFYIFSRLLEFFMDYKDQRSSIKTEIGNLSNYIIFIMALNVLKDKVTSTEINPPFEPVQPKPIPDQNLTQNVIFSCLTAMEKALDFSKLDEATNSVKKDELLSELVQVKEVWREIVTNTEFYEFLFTVGYFDPPHYLECVLKIMYLLTSVKKAMFTDNELKTAIFLTIIRKIGEIITNFVNSSVEGRKYLFQISKVLFKLRFMTDNKFVDGLEEYDAFLHVLSEKTEELLNDEQFKWVLNEPQTMINLIKFWGMSKPEFHPILQHFFMHVLELPQLDPDDNGNILDFDSGSISDAIRVVPLYARELLQDILNPIIQELQELFTQYIAIAEAASQENQKQLKVLDQKCSIIIQFLVMVLKQPITTPDQTQILSLQTIISVMHTVFDKSDAISQSETNVVVKSLLIFCKQFPLTNFSISCSTLDNCTLLGEDFYFNDLLSAYDLLLQFVVTAIQAFPSSADTINVATAAFEKLILFMKDRKIPSQNGKTLLSVSEMASQILANFCESPFEFMTQPDFDEYTICASRTLTIISLSNSTNTQHFQSFLDANYETFKGDTDESIFTALINNFIGTFQACTTKQSFDRFFNWLFPDKLDELVTFVSQSEISDFDLIAKYFNFLISTLISPEKSKNSTEITKPKIVLSPHSANGVHLFKSLAIALTDGFNRVINIITQDESLSYDSILAVLMPMFKLMAQIMSAEFVMFEAFQYYEDSTLIDLMQALFTALSHLNISDMFQFPDYAPTAMLLIMSLAKHHMDIMVVYTPEFIGTMLEIVELVINGSNKDLTTTSMETAQYIFTYFLENSSQTEIIQANVQHMRNIAFSLWAKLINEVEVKVFSIMQILRPILIFVPDQLAVLHDHTVQFIPEGAVPEFEETLKDVVACVDNLANIDESKFNSALIHLHQFATKINLSITVPTE